MWGVNKRSFQKLVYHLLSNALKFNDKGDRITVNLLPYKDSVVLQVIDRGTGMKAGVQKNLFELQAPTMLSDCMPNGLGLGLPICKAIATRHQGTLAVESACGKGTTITLTLPKASKEYLGFSDVPLEYGNTFNPLLVHLADGLPSRSYRIRNQD